ncbi:MAG: DNA-3-methyladenine glycosylase I, partial [Ilumatobacteraceae bacterium]
MTKHAALIAGEDSKPRCSWCVGDSEYVRYHDEEWGMPVVNDRLIFEKICLEGFQSGLSWLTILRKRPAFRIAFKNFDPELVAKFNKRDIERLMNNAGIVRHRGKIEATIQNARASLQMQNQGISLAKFVWSFCPEYTAVKSSKKPSQAPKSQRDIQSKTPDYPVRYRLQNCNTPTFQGYPLDVDFSKRDGIQYLSCAVASTRLK